jgi:GT2 family glycosyltransferase
VEVEAPAPVTDRITVRDTILQDLAYERPPKSQLIRDHAHPAITRLQEQRHAQIGTEEVIQYGTPPVSPSVSIIVPLYGRIDFLEHQLSQFVHDSEFAAADLIYVLDSPALAEHLTTAAAGLHQLYGVAFRVVILQRNAGYSAANNIGASFARAPLLLLLNSDVLPDRPGWLGKMAAFHRSKPNLGALGPKLLFEDATLQHAGLYFSPNADRSGWENMHYFKGLHRAFPAANLARRVPAVTGACLMISRDLYEAHGGLRGSYVQGDYEDSDLCLRLSEAGLENWYLPEVELYHLEGQSYPMPLRQLTGRYNRWLHTHLWDTQIHALMTECGSAAS